MAKNTNLRLTEEQESDLIDYAFDRLDSLEMDNRERIANDKQSWNTYNNNRSDRLGADTIYDQSNLGVPITTLIVDHFLARAEDEITGTSPYFRFDPQGASDRSSAEAYDRYFNWKLETRGKIRERLEESYLHIFIQRAAIFKAVYEDKRSQWMDYERNALFNKETEQFEEIYEYGPIIEGVANFLPSLSPETGTPELRLDIDQSFVLDPTIHEFLPYEEGVPTEEVIYSGPKSVVVDSERFLAPSNIENLESADFIAEKYDKDLVWCEEMFLDREWVGFGDYTKSVTKDANPRTESVKNEDSRENLSFDSDKNPQVQVIECWVKRDILGTGIPQDFCLFLDADTKHAIYYEYVAKVTPDNRLPYSVVSINKARNRWYGPSLPEKISSYQEYIDKHFNSQSYRNELAANPIIGVNPDAAEDEPEDIELHAGKIVQLKEGRAMKDFIDFAAIPNMDQHTQAHIDFVFGIVQLWLGVSNLAQGDYQALAPANTATGVEATLREASKIGRRWMRRIVRGFEEHLTKLVKLTINTLDEPEVFEYMEGDVRSFAEMTPEMIKKLDVNVAVILSQNQGQRAIEKSNMALQTQERYFQSAPEMRPFSRPLLKQILDALGYENTDELLPEMAPPDPMQEAEMQKLLSDGAGAPPAAGANTEGAAAAMGNSNTQGANQYQQQAG